MKEGDAQMNELIGFVHTIFATKEIPGVGTRRSFVIKTEENKPQDVMFNVTNSRCAVLNNFRQDDKVKITFFVAGKIKYDDDQKMIISNSFHVHYIEKIN